MVSLQDIRDVTTDLPASEMLRYLLKDRFPNDVVVTASLKSSSIVVLKLVSEIDPTTPVVFCHPTPVFPESEQYRSEIIGLLGLTDIKVVTESDPLTGRTPFTFTERLWNDASGGMGKVQETIHLHDTIGPYSCWIKAAYHDRPDGVSAQRVDIYGRKVIVDPLRRRTIKAIDQFMLSQGLPYHPRISHKKKKLEPIGTDGQDIGCHF